MKETRKGLFFIIYSINHTPIMEKYDAILYVDEPINENDSRLYARSTPGDVGGFSQYFNADDPKMYTQFNFGQSLRSLLSSMNNGFSAEITDFKKWVTVRVTHNNIITGKSSTKSFLIVFKHKGDGIVLSTHNKYRTISGVDQAASYIRNVCNSLTNDTNNRIG